MLNVCSRCFLIPGVFLKQLLFWGQSLERLGGAAEESQGVGSSFQSCFISLFEMSFTQGGTS